MTTSILWLYPLHTLFRRILRVDSRYAYLVVPLRRREGCLSAIWRYVVYGEWKWNGDSYFEKVVLSDYDEVSSFFSTQMLKEEYDEPIEESFGELGKLWDKKYDALYGSELDKMSIGDGGVERKKTKRERYRQGEGQAGRKRKKMERILGIR